MEVLTQGINIRVEQQVDSTSSPFQTLKLIQFNTRNETLLNTNIDSNRINSQQGDRIMLVFGAYIEKDIKKLIHSKMINSVIRVCTESFIQSENNPHSVPKNINYKRVLINYCRTSFEDEFEDAVEVYLPDRFLGFRGLRGGMLFDDENQKTDDSNIINIGYTKHNNQLLRLRFDPS